MSADERPVQSAPASARSEASEDGLLGRIDVIEAQPLDERAEKFDQVYEQLLAELQAGDGAR